MKYWLMNRRRPIVLLELDEITGAITAVKEVLNKPYLPVGLISANGTLERAALVNWWQSRSIPASRSGLRDALEMLGVSSPGALLHKCYGLSLSDQYWINPTSRPLSWDDINFFHNPFSDDVGDALFGRTPESAQIDWLSPCSTSDGWLKKRWKIIDGQRYLVKSGSGPFRQEPLNEQVVSLILDKLHIPHVPYTVVWEDNEPYSICPDFITPETELVPMVSIFGTRPRNPDEPLYQHVLKCCDGLGIPDIRPALEKMLTVDALVANTDRHLSNFGAIRNVETLEWVGLAPVYDNGTSLWHKELTPDIGPDAPVVCRPFAKTHAAQLKMLHTNFEWFDFDALRGVQAEAAQVLGTSRYLDAARVEAISKALAANVFQIQEQSHAR